MTDRGKRALLVAGGWEGHQPHECAALFADVLRHDGFEVTVPEGTSIMRAAMEAEIQVPKLCATDMVDAFGSCRLCLVEVDGRNGTPSSCTLPVAERSARYVELVAFFEEAATREQCTVFWAA